MVCKVMVTSLLPRLRQNQPYVPSKPAVSKISPDAITREKEGLIYLAGVELDRTTIAAQGRDVALGSGMAAAVEIKTGKRRMIEYMLDPLIRYRSEAMREQ